MVAAGAACGAPQVEQNLPSPTRVTPQFEHARTATVLTPTSERPTRGRYTHRRRDCWCYSADSYGRWRGLAASRFGTITLRRKEQTSSPRWLKPRVSTLTTPRS